MDTKRQFESMLSELELQFTHALRGISKPNGVVERYDRTLSY